MAVLSGFVTQEEFNRLKKRIDVTIVEKRASDKDKDPEWGRHIYVKLDCNWGVMEFLSQFQGSDDRDNNDKEFDVIFSLGDRIYNVKAKDDKEAEEQAWIELADDARHQLIRDFVDDVTVEEVECDLSGHRDLLATIKDYTEGCECGGVAKFAYFDENNKEYHMPIMKCGICEDEFEADDSMWIKKKNKNPRRKQRGITI